MSSEVGTDSGLAVGFLDFASLRSRGLARLTTKLPFIFPNATYMVGDVFPISISKTAEQLPLDPLLTLTRTAIGLGLGLLMADKIKPSIRQAAAITLVAIGALAATPWLVKITVGQINRSEWGSRARLRSIRGDSGYTSDNDIY